MTNVYEERFSFHRELLSLSRRVEDVPGAVRTILQWAPTVDTESDSTLCIETAADIVQRRADAQGAFMEEARLILPMLKEQKRYGPLAKVVGHMAKWERKASRAAAHVRESLPLLNELAKKNPMESLGLAISLAQATHGDKDVTTALTAAMFRILDQMMQKDVLRLCAGLIRDSALESSKANPFYLSSFWEQGLAYLPFANSKLASELTNLLPSMIGDAENANGFICTGFRLLPQLEGFRMAQDTVHCLIKQMYGLARATGRESDFVEEGVNMTLYATLPDSTASFLQILVEESLANPRLAGIFLAEAPTYMRQFIRREEEGKARALALAVGMVADPGWDRASPRAWRELVLEPPGPTKSWSVLLPPRQGWDSALAVIGPFSGSLGDVGEAVELRAGERSDVSARQDHEAAVLRNFKKLAQGAARSSLPTLLSGAGPRSHSSGPRNI